MVQSTWFENFIMLVIIVNSLCLCLDYHGINHTLNRILKFENYTCIAIFTIEAIIKIVAYGFTYYWYVKWNKFDFIIAIMNIVAVIGENTLFREISFNVTILRIVRVARLLKILKMSKGLRTMLKTLYMSLGSIFTTAALLTLTVFVFSVAAMSLFG